MADSSKYKNQYYVLAEFIKFLIAEFDLYSFSIIEIIDILSEEFDFSIPYAVCKASLKRIAGLRRTGDEYTVISKETVSDDFEQINKNAVEEGSRLIEQLIDFANKEKVVDEEDYDKWIDQLESEFIKYILDRKDSQELQYGDLISHFCITIENNTNLKGIIERIREGSILYCGLCYNIIDTGSIKDNITLYLDTEILFYLAGYNGQLSQRIVLDLIDQIKNANRKEKKIILTYFSEIQEEIDRYFTAARNIIAGKGGIITSRAMASIVNECKHESDVLNKQSDFYFLLENTYGIKPDENAGTYYNEDNYKYNLESHDSIEDGDPQTEEAMRFISYINILRKGQEYTDFIKSQFLIITETKKLIEASDKQKPDGKVGYAISANSMTNILWMKLGGVFGNGTFPSNVSIVVKARMALGKSISANVNRLYTQTVIEYQSGIIQEDQAVARLLRLQDKIVAPENISDTNIEDLIDFSPESLQKYEEALRQGKLEVTKKERIINDLEKRQKKVDEANEELQKQNELKTNTIKEQEQQLQLYKEKEKKEKEDQENKKKRIIKGLKIFAYICVSGLVMWVLGFLPDKYFFVSIFRGVAGLVGLYSGICTIWPESNVFRKPTSNIVNENEDTKVDYETSIINWITADLTLVVVILFLVFLCVLLLY